MRSWTFGRGGIGRRACLRCMYPKGCGGSSPLDRTTELQRVPARSAGRFLAGPIQTPPLAPICRRAPLVAPRQSAYVPSDINIPGRIASVLQSRRATDSLKMPNPRFKHHGIAKFMRSVAMQIEFVAGAFENPVIGESAQQFIMWFPARGSPRESRRPLVTACQGRCVL